MPQDTYLTPRKQFQFRVTIYRHGVAPLETFAVQSITLPEKTIESVEHGHGNTVLKTGGQVKVGNLTLNRILDAADSSISAYFEAWQSQVQDALNNAGMAAGDYKCSIIIHELGTSQPTDPPTPSVVGQWTFHGCWPTRIGEREYDRTSSDNVIETVEFAVDFMSNP